MHTVAIVGIKGLSWLHGSSLCSVVFALIGNIYVGTDELAVLRTPAD